MVTGFNFNDCIDSWWENINRLSKYNWIFTDGKGCCLTFTYETRGKDPTFTDEVINK
jgi:hypothetical protein